MRTSSRRAWTRSSSFQNRETTSQTLKLAKAAGVPEFHLTHNPPNEPGLAGFAGYDWVYVGKLAGKSAIQHGVKRVIMIEGKLGQGTAAGRTEEGFLKAYKDAGKDIGNLAQNVGVGKAPGARTFRWCSGFGGWFADPAKKVMQDAITSLGPDGFDGAYVENDEMMAGALQAMQEAGVDPSKYWLGSATAKSWAWVQKGITTMDVNDSPDAGSGHRASADQGALRGEPVQEGRLRLRYSVQQERISTSTSRFPSTMTTT